MSTVQYHWAISRMLRWTIFGWNIYGCHNGWFVHLQFVICEYTLQFLEWVGFLFYESLTLEVSFSYVPNATRGTILAINDVKHPKFTQTASSFLPFRILRTTCFKLVSMRLLWSIRSSIYSSPWTYRMKLHTKVIR